MNRSEMSYYRNDILLNIGLILYNLTIFFSDLLPYNTVLKFIALIFLVVDLLLFCNAKIEIYTKYLPYILFTIYLWINILVGGDIDFVITFSINTLILLVLFSFPYFIKIEINIIGIMCGIHLIASLMVQILPTDFVNTLFSQLMTTGYSSNYSWRIISGINVGITNQPGVNAMYLVSFFAFCLAKIYAKSRLKVLNFMGMILSLSFVFLTGKRFASIFAPLCVLILLFLFGRRKLTIKKLVMISAICTGMILILSFLNEKMAVFSLLIDKTTSLANNDMSNGRFELWRNALGQFWKNPILGIGVKNFYNSTGFDVHNTYIQILVETGIIGISLFGIAIVVMLKNLISASKKLFMNQNETIIVPLCYGIYILIFLLIYGIVGNTFIDYLPLSLFVISVALVNACVQYARINGC